MTVGQLPLSTCHIKIGSQCDRLSGGVDHRLYNDAQRYINAAAIRCAKRRATRSFGRRGHTSTPSAVMIQTAFSSPPITPLADETSLATIQSAFLLRSLARALSNKSFVSAAKPITRRGLLGPGAATEA